MADVSSLVYHISFVHTKAQEAYFVLPSNILSKPRSCCSSPCDRVPDSLYCHIPTALFFPLPTSLELMYAIYSLLIFSTTDTNFGVASKAELSEDELELELDASELAGGRVCRTKDRSGFS
jgi:hypothetical protein